MEQTGVGWWLLLEDLDSAIANPTPDFPADQSCEHDEKPGAYLVPKYRHGQAGFGDSEPGALGKLLNLYGAEWAEAKSCHAIEKCTVEEEREVDQDQ